MSAPIRRQVLPLLLSLVSHPEDTSRSAASGCLGNFFLYPAMFGLLRT